MHDEVIGNPLPGEAVDEHGNDHQATADPKESGKYAGDSTDG
jgi:hypothetical protein